MINCIVVDDERLLRESLSGFIAGYCPGLQVVGRASGADEARKILEEEQVDVIFCDIRMPGESGFDFLASIDTSRYHIVFVTAYNEYALQALKSRAFDYLLKPVDIEELKLTAAALVDTIRNKRNDDSLRVKYQVALKALVDEIGPARAPEKIALHHSSGILFVSVADILYLEGDGAYTVVHLLDGSAKLVTKILSEFEHQLSGHGFLRIHKSSVVNMNHVAELNREDGAFIILSNGVKLEISRRRIRDVLSRFQHFAKKI